MISKKDGLDRLRVGAGERSRHMGVNSPRGDLSVCASSDHRASLQRETDTTDASQASAPKRELSCWSIAVIVRSAGLQSKIRVGGNILLSGRLSQSSD